MAYNWSYVYNPNGSPQRQIRILDSNANYNVAGISGIGLNFYQFYVNGEKECAIVAGIYMFIGNQSPGYVKETSYACMYYILTGYMSSLRSKFAYDTNHDSIEVTTTLHNAIKELYPGATDISTCGLNTYINYMFNKYTKFHIDPVYIEATKLKYTDGTYNFAIGVCASDKARKIAYKHLLNTYGTFYKGTEEELSSSFAQSISSPDINGGGGN